MSLRKAYIKVSILFIFYWLLEFFHRAENREILLPESGPLFSIVDKKISYTTKSY